MAAYWWIDSAGARQGPVEQDEFARLIEAGTVRRETLAWSEGMAQWTGAGDIAALGELFEAAPPPPPNQPHAWPAPPATQASAPLAQPGGPALSSSLGAWGLFWRAIVATIGNILIVPAPWTSVAYLKYLGETTHMPNGQALKFDGEPRDIWWVFVLQGVMMWSGAAPHVGIVGALVNFGLSWLVLQWFCSRLRTGEGGAPFSFDGGFWPFVGWCLLFIVSFVTIIGWAWALQFVLRWVCRNVSGPARFDFAGAGLEILWRCIACVILCSFVIPIPWAMAWLVRWFVSQIVVAEPASA